MAIDVPNGKILTLREAITLAKDRGIRDEKFDRGAVILVLADGSELHFESQYEGGNSSWGPGDGIQPPTATYKAAS